MCLSPITIPNQSKYISLRHKDHFLLQVPCGHCVECQKTLSNQWYYRAWYEWNNLDTCNGYVLFDTLTYRESDLPKLSNTWSFLDKNMDYPCFDYSHIRKFLQLLRTRLIRKGYEKNAFRYFLSTEYGASRWHTHRPHIHVLFYVYDNRINPIEFSALVAELWKYGRTDGVPYKTHKYVMSKNVVFANNGLSSKLHTCRYVTKYVQKCCEFQSELDKRVVVVMRRLADYADPTNPDKWLESEYARRERLKLLRMVNQFHRQSQHFGESALADLDLNQLKRDGCLYMPDFKSLKIPIPLSTYYKRKLMYDLVEFNGSRYWVINDFGKEFKEARKNAIFANLVARYNAIKATFHLDFDTSLLADYVLNRRGRIKGDLPESTLIDRINEIDFINYSSSSDKLQFGCRGLTTEWLGDSQQGYKSSNIDDLITLKEFISKYVYFDDKLESDLDEVMYHMSDINIGRDNFNILQQKLTNLYKYAFSVM